MTKETEALDVTDAEEMRDWLAECIDDSIDMDWQSSWAADLILKRMDDEGITFSRPTGQGGDVGEVLAAQIAHEISEGNGVWVACSGCQESGEGYVSTEHYPYSEVFRCQPGMGCRDCGGLGVVWDSTDYEEYARFMREQDALSTLRAGQATTADTLLREARTWIFIAEHDEDCEIHPDYGAHNLERANDEAEQEALDNGGDERDVRYRTHPEDAVCTCERGDLLTRIDAHLNTNQGGEDEAR